MNIKTSIVEINGCENVTPAILSTLVRPLEDNIPTTEEKWELLREVRDELLSQCDWVVTKAYESSTDIPTDWITYRQALRDIPQDYSTPEDVVFPVMPS